MRLCLLTKKNTYNDKENNKTQIYKSNCNKQQHTTQSTQQQNQTIKFQQQRKVKPATTSNLSMFVFVGQEKKTYNSNSNMQFKQQQTRM